MAERRWISREEIAEIYDERAKRAALIGGPGGNTDEAHRLWRRAEQIRATERLSKPVGSRVA